MYIYRFLRDTFIPSQDVRLLVQPPAITPYSILRALFVPGYSKKVDIYYKGKNIFNFIATPLCKWDAAFPMNLKIRYRESLIITIVNTSTSDNDILLAFVWEPIKE